jgi:hypothetical protein
MPNVSPIHLHAFLGVGEFYEGGSRVPRPHVKWSATAESLRNTDLPQELTVIFTVERLSGNPPPRRTVYIKIAAYKFFTPTEHILKLYLKT